MRRLFLLSLFTISTVLVENRACLADESFYEKLRKSKNPSQTQIEQMKTDSGEGRRKKLNAVSAKNSADAKSPERPATRYTEKDNVDESNDEKPLSAAEIAVRKKAYPDEKDDEGSAAQLPGPVSAKGRPSVSRPAPVHSEGSTGVKVNPGDIDELEFPGEPTPKPVAKPSPKKK